MIAYTTTLLVTLSHFNYCECFNLKLYSKRFYNQSGFNTKFSVVIYIYFSMKKSNVLQEICMWLIHSLLPHI